MDLQRIHENGAGDEHTAHTGILKGVFRRVGRGGRLSNKMIQQETFTSDYFTLLLSLKEEPPR